ncbi:hypothetical protein EVAR_42583_1 [Eumeta japonica]|uniref:Uncharacterized protein n=1 Tax=Eumeta variegata TaxID=151549 RepID=A0A4C1ZVA6_EUMVA|nr:hypothetical protein EVAR_42583_1 [Eumeta japonica]
MKAYSFLKGRRRAGDPSALRASPWTSVITHSLAAQMWDGEQNRESRLRGSKSRTALRSKSNVRLKLESRRERSRNGGQYQKQNRE